MEYEKKYKDALERAKKNYISAQDLTEGAKIGVECFKNTLESIFPELKDEDEKIRKFIIRQLLKIRKTTVYNSNLDIELANAIDWLKKQDEISTKSVHIADIPFGAKDSELFEESITIPDGYYAHIDNDKVIIKRRGKSALEAIKEEKVDSANKIEPKFHEGDWIIRSAEGFKHDTYLIKEIKDYYVCEDLKGRRVTFTFNDVHKNFKLWDISDMVW